MNKDVIIFVRGIQTSANMDSNTLELVTEAKYYKKQDTHYITYKESTVTGLEGTTTTIKISEDGVVTLIRFGSVNTQFIFEKGQKHLSYYETEHGTFTMSVIANKVAVAMNENGGELRVDYHLEINNNIAGENDLHMYIREAGQFDEQYLRSCST